jgi:hypothetical protein
MYCVVLGSFAFVFLRTGWPHTSRLARHFSCALSSLRVRRTVCSHTIADIIVVYCQLPWCTVSCLGRRKFLRLGSAQAKFGQRTACLAGNKNELLKRIVKMNTQVGTHVSGILFLRRAKLISSVAYHFHICSSIKFTDWSVIFSCTIATIRWS